MFCKPSIIILAILLYACGEVRFTESKSAPSSSEPNAADLEAETTPENGDEANNDPDSASKNSKRVDVLVAVSDGTETESTQSDNDSDTDTGDTEEIGTEVAVESNDDQTSDDETNKTDNSNSDNADNSNSDNADNGNSDNSESEDSSMTQDTPIKEDDSVTDSKVVLDVAALCGLDVETLDVVTVSQLKEKKRVSMNPDNYLAILVSGEKAKLRINLASTTSHEIPGLCVVAAGEKAHIHLGIDMPVGELTYIGSGAKTKTWIKFGENGSIDSQRSTLTGHKTKLFLPKSS